MTMYRIKTLAELVDGWRKTSLARNLANELLERLKEGKAPFEGAPLPEALVKKRLPAGIKSAWMFVLRAETTTPSHYHPNSVQHMAVIGGGGAAVIAASRTLRNCAASPSGANTAASVPVNQACAPRARSSS